MIRRCLAVVLSALLLSQSAFAAFDTTIDGHEVGDLDILDFNGFLTEPATSPLGKARIFYNDIEKKLYLSVDGDPYDELGAGGATIGDPVVDGTPNSVLFIDGSGNLAQASGFTFDGTTFTAPAMNASAAASGPKLFVRNTSGGGASMSAGAGSSFSYVLFPSSKSFGMGAVSDITAAPSSSDFKFAVDSSSVYLGTYASLGSEPIIGWGNFGLGDNGTNTAPELRLYEPSGSGTNYASFKSPALSANTNYTWPTDDGSSGEFLQTNGSGVLDWVTPSGSNWTDAGTYLRPNTGGDSMRVIGSGGTGYLDIGVTTNQPKITYNWTGNSVALIVDNPEYDQIKLVLDGDLDLVLGNSGGVPFIGGTHANSAVAIGFYANALLPGLQTTTVALDGFSYQDNTKDIGSSSYRWRNVYIGTGLYGPNGTAPTVSTAGQIAVDTTDDQFAYYGGAKRIVTYKHRTGFTMETPAAGDDGVPIFSHEDGFTITKMRCWTVGGTSAEITLTDGSNALDTMTCDADGADDDGSISNATFTAGEQVLYNTGTVTGSVTWVNFMFTYTITSE